MARLLMLLLLIGIVVGVVYLLRQRNRYRPPGD
jgi:hypothetical protein